MERVEFSPFKRTESLTPYLGFLLLYHRLYFLNTGKERFHGKQTAFKVICMFMLKIETIYIGLPKQKEKIGRIITTGDMGGLDAIEICSNIRQRNCKMGDL